MNIIMPNSAELKEHAGFDHIAGANSGGSLFEEAENQREARRRLGAALIDPDNSDEDKIKLITNDFPMEFIPRAVGWRIVVKAPWIDQYSDGGIEKPPETMTAEKYQTAVSHLIGIGESYLRNKETGKDYCFKASAAKIGDLVVFGKHGGQSAIVETPDGEKTEFLILNDDEILAIVHPLARVQTWTPEMMTNIM